MELTKKEMVGLQIAYKSYRAKGRLERKAVERIFYYATGKKLGAGYYSIPVVRKLMELQG